jgi:hypothetical protein
MQTMGANWLMIGQLSKQNGYSQQLQLSTHTLHQQQQI